MKKVSPRMWCTLILIGLVGQFAWTIENMYFNVFLYNTISTDPGYISAMVGWSAAAATLTTLLMGALSDTCRQAQAASSCGGYILWGLSTAGLRPHHGAKTRRSCSRRHRLRRPPATMVVVLDCVMTFFGSTANDAAFNAWHHRRHRFRDNRGRAESVLAIAAADLPCW